MSPCLISFNFRKNLDISFHVTWCVLWTLQPNYSVETFQLKLIMKMHSFCNCNCIWIQSQSCLCCYSTHRLDACVLWSHIFFTEWIRMIKTKWKINFFPPLSLCSFQCLNLLFDNLSVKLKIVCRRSLNVWKMNCWKVEIPYCYHWWARIKWSIESSSSSSSINADVKENLITSILMKMPMKTVSVCKRTVTVTVFPY